MRYITAIRMGPGNSEEHIARCLTLNGEDGKAIVLAPAGMAQLILKSGLVYKVGSPSGPVDVVAVKVAGEPHHIRTEANGTQTDNLLQLPRF